MPYKHDPNDPGWIAHTNKYGQLHLLHLNLRPNMHQVLNQAGVTTQSQLRNLLSQDVYLNNIPLQLWDDVAVPLLQRLPKYTFHLEGEFANTWVYTGRIGGWSLGEIVCLLKETARYASSKEYIWPTPASPPSSPETSAPSKSPASSSMAPSPTTSPSTSVPPPSPSKPT